MQVNIISKILKTFTSNISAHSNRQKSSFSDLLRGLRKRDCYDIVVPGKVSPPRSVPEQIKKPEYWLTGLPFEPPTKPEIKSYSQIQKLRASCRLAASILNNLNNFVKVGVTTDEIDEFVHNECLKNNAYPSPLNYRLFPKSVCTSVNNIACHGIPDDRKLKAGDIVNIDISVYRDGYHGDCSAMFCVGDVDDEGIRLCDVTHKALLAAIDICKPGVPFAHIGKTIEEITAENGFTVLPSFAGHGIGTYFHGPPDIHHFENDYDEGVMEAGMSFTIEPAIGEGSEVVEVLEDGWTAATVDGSRSAQWEHTILVTSSGSEILTLPL